MKKEQILLLAIGYFASHPSVNEFHVTSDGQHFIDVNNANAHAANLKNKDVSIVTRAEAEAAKAQAKKPAKETSAPAEEPATEEGSDTTKTDETASAATVKKPAKTAKK